MILFLQKAGTAFFKCYNFKATFVRLFFIFLWSECIMPHELLKPMTEFSIVNIDN